MLNDELQKLKGGVSLDLSLEKSRAKEDVSGCDWEVLILIQLSVGSTRVKKAEHFNRESLVGLSIFLKVKLIKGDVYELTVP